MRRADGSICLLDLAEVRTGHWLEDALYLERLSWSHPERLREEDPVHTMMHARTELGLDNGPDIERLAVARETDVHVAVIVLDNHRAAQ